MRIITILLALFFCTSTFSQVNLFFDNDKALPLTQSDSILLSNLPELTLPEGYGARELPYRIDNAGYPYFRPIFNQVGASCGQSCGVVYNFTYEMDRARDLPADTSINQYPSHFTWNFMNGGNGWYGVSYLHSFEILKTLGTPTIFQYGGLALGDGEIWITGYEKYYDAMKNRIRAINQIKVGEPDGLEILKHWLHSHLDGSEIGGIASYYAVSPWNFGHLAPDTPEAGSAVMFTFNGIQSNHAMTIVGYNDSIRWDYNNDGQFTNDIDINEDGIVDMKDWEIGGVRFANSYGDTWADSGFCYLMYKTFADEMYEGGIWNHSVHVLDVKENYGPELTLKVKIRHDSRDKLKIMAGLSNNVNDFIPEHVLDFPVFNYQGGHQYMQGGRETEENKTIEVGLDITPLLSYVNPGEETKIFLTVNENDPNNAGTGEIIKFSVIDYTNGINEIECEDENIPIKDNGITRMSLLYTPTMDKVEISTTELPAAVAGEPYETQLTAENGTPGYLWEMETKYYQQSFEADFPQIDEVELEPGSPFLAFANQEIEFDFPFYGETHNNLYIHWGGFIMFDDDLYPWPYYNDPYLLFRSMKNVSAFLCKTLSFYPPIPKSDDGLWYEGNENYAAFRWNKTLYNDQQEIGHAEFAVILYPDGNIEYYFNDILVDEDLLWYTGVSKGDKTDFQLLGPSNSDILPRWGGYQLIPDLPPPQLMLSKQGLLSGSPQMDEKIYNLTFRVTDDHNISNTKTLQFSDGLIFSYEIHAGNDSIVQFGEEVTIDVTVKNIFTEVFHDVGMTVSSNDPNLEITGSSAQFGDIPAGAALTIEDAFSMNVSNSCPDKYSILLNTELQATEADWTGKIFIETHSPGLHLSNYRIDDGDNNKLDPGETVDFYITITNDGSATGEDIYGELYITDRYVTINAPATQYFEDLKPGESKEIAFSVTADEGTPLIHEAAFGFEITAEPELVISETFSIFVGQYPVLVINKAENNTSADAIQEALDSLEIEYFFLDSIPDHPEFYKSIFLCLGPFYANYPLSTDEGTILAEYLDEGGMLYMEGTVTWHLDPVTAVHSKFHVEKMDIPWASFEQLTGVEDTFTEDMLFDFGGQFTMVPYYLKPRSEAFTIFMMDTSSYLSCAVAYENNIYRTVGAMFEFGSLETENSVEDRELLMKGILEFFDLGEYFVGIEEINNSEIKPGKISCYPNPFTQSTALEFSLEVASVVEIEVFDLSGMLIKKPLRKQLLQAGSYSVKWDAKDEWQREVSPGIYIYQIKAGDAVKTGKLVKME